MGSTFYFEWEVRLMEMLQGFGGSFGVAIASFITNFGGELVLVAIMGFIYWSLDKEYGKYIFTVFVPALVYAPILKNIACRRRPYMDHPSIKCLSPVDSSADIYDIAAQGYSFPSMHSANSTTIYGSLTTYNIRKKSLRKWMVAVSVLVPLLIGISRAYVGVHYPTDILFGWCFGLASLLVMDRIYAASKRKWLVYLILILIAFPGLFICSSNDYYSCYGIMIGGFAGFLLEEKKVNFEKATSVVFMITRLIGGLALFGLLEVILKAPFSSEFLHSATKAAFIVRLLRYIIICFLIIGVYPMCFKFESKVKSKLSK